MKKILVAAVLLAVSQSSFAWGNWIPSPYDKVAHAVVAAGITIGGEYFLHEKQGWDKDTATVTAASTAVGVIYIKELTDVNFDLLDFSAGVGGAAFGVGIIIFWPILHKAIKDFEFSEHEEWAAIHIEEMLQTGG